MPGFNKDGKAGSGMGRGQGLGRGQGRGMCQNTQNTAAVAGVSRRLGQCFRNLVNRRSKPEQSQPPSTTNQYDQKD